MNWILAVDVRDGQRLAFPADSTAVSCDLVSYHREMEESLSHAQETRLAAVQKLRAEIELAATPRGAGKAAIEEFREMLDQKMREVDATIDEQVAEAARDSRRKKSAEAILYFGDKGFPVRGLKFTDQWLEVLAYTSREDEREECDT